MTKRRFIAGAVCPKCKEMDKTVVLNRDGIDMRQCVQCGFEEKKVFLSATQEPATRVNQSEKLQQADEVAVVKIFESDNK